MADITVVGGGLAGLLASIASAEKGARVRLHEAHQTLGGRARASAPPFIAHEGPHVLYDDGPLWRWLDERDLVGPAAHVPLRALVGIRFRWRDRLHSFPPAGMLPMLARRRRRAPVGQSFHTWAAERFGEEAATAAANYLGVVTFDHDPGRLSAAFAWQRLLRATAVPPRARYVIGGWTSMVARLEARARTLGVRIELGSRVDRLPEPPVIVATSLDSARQLLGDDSLHWDSGRTLLLDLSLRRRRGDAFVISDLDEAGWAEDYAIPDPTVAPPGPLPGPGADAAAAGRVIRRRAGAPGAPAGPRLSRLAGATDLAAPGSRQRPHRCPRPARADLAGPARGRPRRWRVPGRRHGRRPGPAQRGLLRQRPPRQPPRPAPCPPIRS